MGCLLSRMHVKYPLERFHATFKDGCATPLIFFIFFPDYDTEKTVVCSSRYIYDESRQRSLQHFIEFEELPEKDKSIGLPSGTYAGKYLIKTQVEDANNTV